MRSPRFELWCFCLCPNRRLSWDLHTRCTWQSAVGTIKDLYFLLKMPFWNMCHCNPDIKLTFGTATLLRSQMFSLSLCLLHEMGRHIVFSSVDWTVCLSVSPSVRPSIRTSVCPSVRQSVCPSHFCVRSVSFKSLVVCTNVSYNEPMCNAYVWPRSVEEQGQSLRLNVVWRYFESALYLLNPMCLQITFLKC